MLHPLKDCSKLLPARSKREQKRNCDFLIQSTSPGLLMLSFCYALSYAHSTELWLSLAQKLSWPAVNTEAAAVGAATPQRVEGRMKPRWGYLSLSTLQGARTVQGQPHLQRHQSPVATSFNCLFFPVCLSNSPSLEQILYLLPHP